MLRLTVNLLTSSLLLTIAPIALADSLQVSTNSNFVASISSPNDNFWGEYSTTMGLYDLPHTGPNAVTSTTFSDVSLFVPAGATITSATIQIVPVSEVVDGTGALYVAQAFAPPDPGAPSTAPTFSSDGSSDVQVGFDQYLTGSLSPIVSGDEVSTGNLSLYFDLNGSFDDSVTNAGINWAGYIGANGQIDIPYTVLLDVTYTPTPEPSSIALLATGLLAAAEVARRKFCLK